MTFVDSIKRSVGRGTRPNAAPATERTLGRGIGERRRGRTRGDRARHRDRADGSAVRLPPGRAGRRGCGAPRARSPALTELRAAHIQAIVPLVAQGELIGALYLGPRLSDQEYSADDRKLLTTLAAQAAPAIRVAQLVREQAVEIEARERLEQEMRVATLIQQQFLPRELPRCPTGRWRPIRACPRGRRRLLRLHRPAGRPDRDRRRRRDGQGRSGGTDHGPDPVRPPRRGARLLSPFEGPRSGRTRSCCPRCRRGCS